MDFLLTLLEAVAELVRLEFLRRVFETWPEVWLEIVLVNIDYISE